MKKNTLLFLASSLLLALSLRAQTASTTPPPIPEEARRHFVMGETMFKEAKAPGDFVLAEGEFKQATDLAPQWPDARYNLALAKEAAGDFPGAMADLKLYQQFKLTDSEARAAQDKIYAIEAKQQLKASAATAKAAADEAAAQKDNFSGADFVRAFSTPFGDWVDMISIRGNNVIFSFHKMTAVTDLGRRNGNYVHDFMQVSVIGYLSGRQVVRTDSATTGSYLISDDGQSMFLCDEHGKPRTLYPEVFTRK